MKAAIKHLLAAGLALTLTMTTLPATTAYAARNT